MAAGFSSLAYHRPEIAWSLNYSLVTLNDDAN
jgi:hypothetical protein